VADQVGRTAKPEARILASEERQAEFDRRGFTVVDLLSPEEVRASWEMIEAAAPAQFDATARGGRAFQFHASFLHEDQDYRRRIHGLIRDALQPKLDRLLCGYEILLAGLFLKAPGTGMVPLHFDWTMVPDLSVVGINVWCPLIDVDVENGALHLVEGSQRAVPHIGAPGTPMWCAGLEEELTSLAVPVPLRAGQALVYDNTILHWSPPNRSAAIRPVIALNCLPRTVRPAFYRLDAESGGARFEKFDMGDGRHFKVQAADFFSGEIDAPRLGYVSNENRTLGREEAYRAIGVPLPAVRASNRETRISSAIRRIFSRG
jgi:hypothetical protein